MGNSVYGAAATRKARPPAQTDLSDRQVGQTLHSDIGLKNSARSTKRSPTDAAGPVGNEVTAAESTRLHKLAFAWRLSIVNPHRGMLSPSRFFA